MSVREERRLSFNAPDVWRKVDDFCWRARFRWLDLRLSLLPLQQAAKALAVTVPPTLVATADEVIEQGANCCTVCALMGTERIILDAAFDVCFSLLRRGRCRS
jgi:hypothetical protein